MFTLCTNDSFSLFSCDFSATNLKIVTLILLLGIFVKFHIQPFTGDQVLKIQRRLNKKSIFFYFGNIQSYGMLFSLQFPFLFFKLKISSRNENEVA